MTIARDDVDAVPAVGGALVPVHAVEAPVGPVNGEPAGEVMSVAEAEHLTAAIRVAVESLHVLLWRAWSRRAWEALGFPDWRSFVSDLGISRSRSYQLLDQQRVALSVAEAAGVPVSEVTVTEAAARELKSRLPEVVAEVRDATEGLDSDVDRDQVLRVVQVTLDAARHSRPEASGPNTMPSMASLRVAGRKAGSGDLWFTPRNAVYPLLPSLPDPSEGRIWCPCDVDGMSAIVDVLRDEGWDVVATDIAQGQDYLASTRNTMPSDVSVVVTNPPFSLKRAILDYTVNGLGLDRWAFLLPEISLGDWSRDTLAPLGSRVGMIMLSRRIAYSAVYGQRATSNPPFSSLWLTGGLHEPGDPQIVFREVPAGA